LNTRPVMEKVYNFQVEDLHCYVVGARQVLVHNKSATIDASNGLLDLKQANLVSVFGRTGKIFSGHIFSVQLASRAVV
jgi:hypothetical protein